VRDQSGQKLAHVYFDDESGCRSAAKTRNEARRIAEDIATLPELITQVKTALTSMTASIRRSGRIRKHPTANRRSGFLHKKTEGIRLWVGKLQNPYGDMFFPYIRGDTTILFPIHRLISDAPRSYGIWWPSSRRAYDSTGDLVARCH
jgi:hypothetical protein